MKSVVIIAEAGVNHNGDINLAKELIKQAKYIQADYVKFQSFLTEENISSKAPKTEYQLQTTISSESQFQMLKKLELSLEQTFQLKQYADSLGIGFLTTPAERQNVELVSDLGLDFVKIASESITNYLLLSEIAKLNQKTILSTGMSNIQEIDNAIEVLVKHGLQRDKLTLLHCNSEYPSPYRDLNLKAIKSMKDYFGLEVGLSDHSEGFEATLAAVALGATVIEKHFTLDNQLEGPDHISSLNPKDFEKLIKMVRNVELSLGTGEKKPSDSEFKNIQYMRRSLVARTTIKKGDTFSIENVAAKRPADGISPMEWESIKGVSAKKDYQVDDLITYE
tara:strand:+ start:7613 stop:8620 length:1008 start_codon:yes stop_codon:yes gene_type:complete